MAVDAARASTIYGARRGAGASVSAGFSTFSTGASVVAAAALGSGSATAAVTGLSSRYH
jgi:hypothetical protein